MRRCLLVLLAALLLCGCDRGEKPYKVDTVIRIPANPTQAPGEAPTERSGETLAAEETELAEEIPETEAETEPTEEETSVPTETKNTTQKKNSNKKNTNKKTDNKKETKPAETEPRETKPAQTEPAATQPAATENVGTEPPATEPSATEPPATEPPATEIPATESVPTEPGRYDISAYVQDTVGYDVAARMNEERVSAGLGELSLDARLSAIASCRAWEVCQVWSHTRPDGRGYATVLTDYGYPGGAVGELLVYVTGSGDGADMVRKWMESDGHRPLILSESAGTVGVGVYRANGYTFVCVLLTG